MLRIGTKTQIAAALLIFLSALVSRVATAADKEVCDATADFALGQEDYSAAVMLHQRFLSTHPNDALAHYHLGFAYGMMDRRADEITEYLAAENLGLHRWDLFLNLGRAYLEEHQFPDATSALETAALLGPEHAETHFNLALVYEQQKRLGDAMREITVSRRLASDDREVTNANAIICVETGDLACAKDLWTHLVRTSPDYTPAQTNLMILSRWQSKQDVAVADTRAENLPRDAAGDQLSDEQVAVARNW